MNKFYYESLSKLDAEIRELEIETACPIQKTETVIPIIIQYIYELKEYVLKRGFKNTEEEIQFFKNQKPAIVSKLIYYNAIYKIETKKPNDAKAIRKYLNEELRKLKRFFDNNLEFYKYYRTKNSFLDEKLFVRGKHDIKWWQCHCSTGRYFQSC
ncbi:MAG: tetracycline regulation of excision, RteC [Sphingobacterium sp.]|jgi:hypothetical protein|nr:tetracycline regulation of excision, RteC [Sphingobacterium sp.]